MVDTTRIASIKFLLTDNGKDLLAEQYGAVIDNLSKLPVSARLKNQSLSGSPTAGSIEAKRFVNVVSENYGTARGRGSAEAVHVTPVVIQIKDRKEYLQEVEQSDVDMYGVTGLVQRASAAAQAAATRDLDRAFFTEAVAAGTALTTTATTPSARAEALIQAVESTSNNFVDGVDRDLIALVLSTSAYGELREYLDKVQDGGAAAAQAAATYHGVKVYSTTRLPKGTDAIAMHIGAVAQPVRPYVYDYKQIDLSNAYAFGLFLFSGTKAVEPDLIYTLATPAAPASSPLTTGGDTSGTGR